jgi:enediyne biosynthesis protein E5
MNETVLSAPLDKTELASPEAAAPFQPGAVASPAPTQTTAVAAPPFVDVRRKALLRFAISISALTFVGHLLLGFEQAPIVPIIALVVAYFVSILLEWVDAWAHDRVPEYAGGARDMFYFLLPAHIAALACSMLLYSSSTGYYLFAVVASVGSKYLFRVRSKGRLRHFLNPSNFGIALTLLTVHTVGFVPPYMFLNNTDNFFDWVIPAVVLVLGTLLNFKLTKKMPLILAWVGGYVLQAVARTLLFGDNLWAALGSMTGVAFVLYTNYMISDPGTTPTTRRGQIIFGLSVAAVYGILISLGVAFAIFFALVLVCILRGLTMWAEERRRTRTTAVSAR